MIRPCKTTIDRSIKPPLPHQISKKMIVTKKNSSKGKDGSKTTTGHWFSVPTGSHLYGTLNLSIRNPNLGSRRWIDRPVQLKKHLESEEETLPLLLLVDSIFSKVAFDISRLVYSQDYHWREMWTLHVDPITLNKLFGVTYITLFDTRDLLFDYFKYSSTHLKTKTLDRSKT